MRPEMSSFKANEREDPVFIPENDESSEGEDDFHSADEDDSLEKGFDNRESFEDVPVIEPDKNEHEEKKKESPAETKDDGWESLEDQQSKSTEEEEEDEDFVDEEYLKDLELSMSEEDKLAKKEESLKHKEEGNTLFKAGQYLEATRTYTAGLRICPISFMKERSVLYANRAAAKSKLDLKKEAIIDCTKAIDLDSSYLKAIIRRANLNEETENLDEALKDFQSVLGLDPGNAEAGVAVRRLPPLIEARNEKLKEEMMGKLKDLGNLVLRPFGLSTNNFQLQQDPNSGGYNIQFKQ